MKVSTNSLLLLLSSSFPITNAFTSSSQHVFLNSVYPSPHSKILLSSKNNEVVNEETTIEPPLKTTSEDVGIDEINTPALEEPVMSMMIDPESFFSTPAEYEESIFQCDKNTKLWKDYNINGDYEEADFLNTITRVSQNFLSNNNEKRSYFLRHNLARSGYFTTNAALGTIASRLHERFISKREEPEDSFANTLVNSKAISAMLAEVFLTYEQDYERISEQNKYKLPWDMYTRNRQNNPFYFGQQTTKFINEAIGTLARRNRGSENEKRIWLDASDDAIYPEYYKTAFHYQTDGWMSSESANVYETSTETLFLGRQDAMQRTALVPLVEFAKNNEKKKNLQKQPLKVLEVACGTGRFMTFARDNLPLDTEFTGLDLSPFYLEKARDNDKNWRNIRKSDIEQQNNGESSKINIAPAKFIQAKAEALPFQDEEFDVVLCMYLYHEIPRDIRAKVSSEMARVIKKGGRVILTDSYQLGDRPSMDKFMTRFEKMNEPYYIDYIQDFLPKHFESVGLKPDKKVFCSRTKTLSFDKAE